MIDANTLLAAGHQEQPAYRVVEELSLLGRGVDAGGDALGKSEEPASEFLLFDTEVTWVNERLQVEQVPHNSVARQVPLLLREEDVRDSVRQLSPQLPRMHGCQCVGRKSHFGLILASLHPQRSQDSVEVSPKRTVAVAFLDHLAIAGDHLFAGLLIKYRERRPFSECGSDSAFREFEDLQALRRRAILAYDLRKHLLRVVTRRSDGCAGG